MLHNLFRGKAASRAALYRAHPSAYYLWGNMQKKWPPVGAAFREIIERLELCRHTLYLELLTNSLSICIEFIIFYQATHLLFKGFLSQYDYPILIPTRFPVYFFRFTSWLGAPCGAHTSISQLIYYTKIEKCWCKRSKNSRHLPVLKHIA